MKRLDRSSFHKYAKQFTAKLDAQGKWPFKNIIYLGRDRGAKSMTDYDSFGGREGF